MNNDLFEKSTLILGGNIKVPAGFTHPFADGKEDGSGTFMLSFGGTRVYKNYSPVEGEFELVATDDGYSLTHNGKPFIKKVELVKRFSHAPNQANINIGKFESDEALMRKLDELVATGTVEGISLSTGASNTDEDSIRVIELMHNKYPSIPIGFSYRVVPKGRLQEFKDAGVTEYKLNVGSTADRLFSFYNPDQDYDTMMQCYVDAVEVFGKGRVANSLFVGLGETEEEMRKSINDLASRGVLSDIKIKKVNDDNRAIIEAKVGPISPLTREKLESFAIMLKKAEEENGLDANTYKTLCNACRGCNLVPFMDY